jgi:hypothetical protein
MRFRYHSTESVEPFDSKDRKSATLFQIPVAGRTEDRIIQEVQSVVDIIALGLQAKPEFVEVKGDSERAQFRLAMQPWAHLRFVKSEGEQS